MKTKAALPTPAAIADSRLKLDDLDFMVDRAAEQIRERDNANAESSLRAAAYLAKQLSGLLETAADTLRPPPKQVPVVARFSEADCGGVFDGTRVISDADPGL